MANRPVPDPKRPRLETFVPEIVEIAEPDQMLVDREASVLHDLGLDSIPSEMPAILKFLFVADQQTAANIMSILSAYSTIRRGGGRQFQVGWFTGREEWLRYDPLGGGQGLMRCLICLKVGKPNVWGQPAGCKTLEGCMVEQHENSELHTDAVRILKNSISSLFKKQESAGIAKSGFVALFQILYTIAKMKVTFFFSKLLLNLSYIITCG
jgi:hypothetical protein